MKFDDEYIKLNQHQKEAVEAIDGCVMVVAGPGTGKTQVLGARIANILKKTDTNPENILCLTFTEAATTALRNRLFSFIGSESYKVNIYTYHGFSNMVIQENADTFGIQDLQPVSELEVAEILKELVDELPNSSKIKRFTGDVYFDIRNLKKLFSLIKKDNLSVKIIEEKVHAKLEEYKNSEDYYYKRKSGANNKGDFNHRKFEDVKGPLERLIDASSMIDVYNAKLKHRKRYDFDDMLSWVLNAFQDNQDLLLKYQETYQYFLVDEYQDTNGIQNELLYTLINYWENPNVFVVGDDDQSIYKFQGANVENIYQFYDKYKAYVKLVVLDQNYRSAQQILDGSNTLIKKNNERLVGKVPNLNKEIVAANNDVANLKNALKIIEYPNTYQEIVGITSKIKQLKKSGQPLQEVGILYRNHKQSDELIQYLEAENISYNVAKTQNVLEVPIIRQLNVFLEYLNLESKVLESGQHLLFDILHFNNFKYLSAFDIAKIGVLLKRVKNEGWRSKLIESGEELDIKKEAKSELIQFVQDVEYWLKEMHNLTLQSLVERVMSKMGFVSRALASIDATFQIQCLKTYYNFLKEETGRQPFITLGQFLEKIDLLIQNKIGLNLNKIVHGIDGVNLMTVHGSKGLEFDYVFLLGCTDKKWEKDSTNLPFRLNEIIVGEPKEAAVEESRRLFYVALTRARKGIEISYAVKDDKDKDLTKSLYVAELEESEVAPIIKETASENEMLHFFDFMISHENKNFINLINQDFVKKEVENFRMSATNLNSYLKCPVSFFYQNIIRVPSAKGEAMTFGSAVHYALDGLFKNSQQGFSNNEAESLLENRFSFFMNNNKESFTEEGLKRRLFYGTKTLKEYFNNYKESWKDDSTVQTEVFYKNCEVNGVPIRGQIDKMEISETSVNVVDFKTGQYKYGKSKVKPPKTFQDNPDEGNFENRFGGDYWRQIMFYKALIDSDNRNNYKVVSGEIDFIEPDKDGFHKEKIVISEDAYAFVKHQIKDTYTKILNLEFDKGCEKEDCMWCNFNKFYHSKLNYNNLELLQGLGDEMEER